MILPISLTAAAAAGIINLWLGIRIGRVRTAEKISVGDGGNERLIRRMRAQANFVEFTPFVLILIFLIELATGTSMVLWGIMALYMLARIAHAFGMDGVGPARVVGILVTMLTLLGLAGYAVYVAQASEGRISSIPASAIETVPAG
jgi:hypothetical protein